VRIDLTGKTAIVTASTKGIGLAAAKGFAAAGARVVINGRIQAGVDAALAEIRAGGGDARGVAADLSDLAGARILTDAVPRADILVNSVFHVAFADFLDLSDEDWNRTWETNVMTAVRLCRHYLPGMEKAGWGRVIFISSESARNIQPQLMPYGATKLALHAVSRGLAKRVAGTGVTSNVVVPGPTLSDGITRMLQPMVDAGMTLEDAGKAFVASHRASSTIKRMATVDEVASMIIYVASPQAAATNGCALRCDGGVIDDVN